ncbi:MAG TPA: DUF4412 domain-containing protein [Gammaproteobacteria bacterium]
MNKNTALATGAALLLCGSGVALAGITYKQTTRSDAMQMSAQVWIDEGGFRVEYLDVPAGNPFMAPGSYMIVRDGSMFLVNPAERTYSRFDASTFAGPMQALGQMGAAGAIDIRDAKVEKVLEEPGEPILGHPTRHYRFESSWTMAIGGGPMSTDYSATEDVWIAEDIAMPQGGASLLESMSLPAPVRELVEAQRAKTIDGLPLRTVTVQSLKVNMGGIGGPLAERLSSRAGGQPTTTTMEVTELQELDVPASQFEIPSDYREVSLFQGGAFPAAPPGP